MFLHGSPEDRVAPKRGLLNIRPLMDETMNKASKAVLVPNHFGCIANFIIES